MILYGLKNCDTCKKAMKALGTAEIPFEYNDVRADPIARSELARFYAELGEPLVNRRSTTWKNLSEAERAGDPVDLMVQNPSLMKRPVIDTGKSLFLGWKSETAAAVLGLEKG